MKYMQSADQTDLSCSIAAFWYIFLSLLSSSTTPSSSTSVLDPFGLMTLIFSTACFFFKSFEKKTTTPKQNTSVLFFFFFYLCCTQLLPSLTSATFLRTAVTLALCFPQVAEACTVWLDLELSSEISPPMGGVHNVLKEAAAFKLRLPATPHPPAWKVTEETVQFTHCA